MFFYIFPIIIIIIIPLRGFHTTVSRWFLLWSLTDSKSPQVSGTLLSILADLNNVIVWMVSTYLSISKYFSLFTNPLGIIPRAAITTGLNVSFMFHSFFFNSLARSKYLLYFSLFFIFTLWSTGTAKSTFQQVSFFTVTRSGHLA